MISEGTSINLPSAIFKDRTLSVLESIVKYLKEKHKFTYKEISIILNRSEKTIWTVYSRVKKKK